MNFTFLLLDSENCLPFNNGNAFNFKRNHKLNREKSKLLLKKLEKLPNYHTKLSTKATLLLPNLHPKQLEQKQEIVFL